MLLLFYHILFIQVTKSPYNLFKCFPKITSTFYLSKQLKVLLHQTSKKVYLTKQVGNSTFPNK